VRRLTGYHSMRPGLSETLAARIAKALAEVQALRRGQLANNRMKLPRRETTRAIIVRAAPCSLSLTR
jgi:hypothetical protein